MSLACFCCVRRKNLQATHRGDHRLVSGVLWPLMSGGLRLKACYVLLTKSVSLKPDRNNYREFDFLFPPWFRRHKESTSSLWAQLRWISGFPTTAGKKSLLWAVWADSSSWRQPSTGQLWGNDSSCRGLSSIPRLISSAAERIKLNVFFDNTIFQNCTGLWFGFLKSLFWYFIQPNEVLQNRLSFYCWWVFKLE